MPPEARRAATQLLEGDHLASAKGSGLAGLVLGSKKSMLTNFMPVIPCDPSCVRRSPDVRRVGHA
jgi:hypothetical protein